MEKDDVHEPPLLTKQLWAGGGFQGMESWFSLRVLLQVGQSCSDGQPHTQECKGNIDGNEWVIRLGVS